MDKPVTSDMAPSQGLDRVSLYAMALTAGIAVANIYYNQPMLGLIEADFPGQSATGLIPTATQLGYAAGLFLLVPLGDIRNRRSLIIGQFVVLAAMLTAAALAPSAGLLVVASLLVGAGATVAQQIVPFAAALADPARRGSVIGTVMAGVLSGILFSRALSGFVGQYMGWRVMFWLGVPLALGAAAIMALTLPQHVPESRISYGAVLRSLGALWMQKPALRRAAFVQAALFGGFTAFWTILALYLQTPAFGLGAGIAGLFGIVGAIGVFAAPLAGKLADRSGPHRVILTGGILALAAWAIFAVWQSLTGLVIGVILLDFGIQSALVSNQHIIYALDPAARSRLNTLFMTGMFLGGSAGSALATLAWTHAGWTGVSILGATLSLIAILLSIRKAG